MRLCSRSNSSTSRAAPSFSFGPPLARKRESTLSSCGSSLSGFAGTVESVRPVNARRRPSALAANGPDRAAPQSRAIDETCSGKFEYSS